MRKYVAIPAYLACLLLVRAAGAQEDPTEYVRKVQDEIAGVVQRVSPAFVNFGGGSGIVISPDGLVLTNHHVAGRSDNWVVRVPGGPRGDRVDAKMMWKDPQGDICLLKLDTGGKQVPCVELGDSDKVLAGQFAIALGTPFLTAENAVPTVTLGVISAIHRNNNNIYCDAIQTDTPINPGNSGGPLLDLKGRLLGINGQIRMRFPTKVSTGIGFAVPINQIKRFLDAFKDVTDGRIVYHGQIQGLSLAAASSSDPRVCVRSVSPGSTADKAGIKEGDIITRLDEYPVFNQTRFYGAMGTYPEGAAVTVALLRAGEEVKLSVILGRAGSRAGPAAGGNPRDPFLGVIFSETPNSDGVELQDVVQGGPAASAGIKAGDVITEFDGKKVENTEDVRKILSAKKPGDKVKVKVLREGETLELEVTIEARGNR